ncbi:hypothetical protein AGABI2DRAFT_117282 [Agaricus bisporus var. bisporus H97]|uniref:hypothetical protein n=1 Tax=Agaricus bisporus var. bisporus (strain H97 / ATCC MYA-4626 / FGSC 10389) TaxID=936046 RepID=UPI00029F6B51|nr:hypothetical protein AGABI2DRAFT_117282 [Agaricus bisporus var. bisporus H97]EKV48461.1 hypothetical protein AGABI2DRAFT_117282 [Agaricus bisporus var. bisporus H97]
MAAQEPEDVVDLQDLQAQIDLSMSFAQNLVTSWVEPTRFSRSGRQADLETEIKEYMRRPARLGVGAPIPETQSLAREAARLKNKLEGGKKRQREPKDVESTVLPSDDEEESRTGAIKKRARQDPFNPAQKKAKNKIVKGGPATQTKPVTAHTSSQLQPTIAVDQSAPAPISANSSTIGDRIPSAVSKISGAPLKSQTQSAPIPASAKLTKLIDNSPTAIPLLSPGHSAELFNRPLLNLGVSPNEDDAEIEKANTSPRKKRKRRKKKKSQQIPLTEH